MLDLTGQLEAQERLVVQGLWETRDSLDLWVSLGLLGWLDLRVCKGYQVILGPMETLDQLELQV